MPCGIVPMYELLVPGRSILAQLRYLQFLLVEVKAVPLSSIVALRAQREQEEHNSDLEEAYHPVIVAVAQAAAGGQPDISFLQEDQHCSARPDLRICIHGQPKYPAGEVWPCT